MVIHVAPSLPSPIPYAQALILDAATPNCRETETDRGADESNHNHTLLL